MNLLTAAAWLLLAAEPVAPADLALVNAKIWTGDAKKPEAEALAILNGKIVAVGTDAEIKTLVGTSTKVIDAKGSRCVPGFIDSHVHLLGGGLQLARVELKDCADETEFGKRLKAFDESTSRDRWMLGGNWDHERSFKGVLPTAEMLDKYAKNRPVFLRRYDGHMALANTAAMKLAGITAATKDPDGGVIGRLADGKTPSGIFKDNAMSLIDKFIPDSDEEEIREGIRAALIACAEQGVTGVHDMDGNGSDTRKKLVKVLQRLASKGELTVRVDLRWPISEQKELAKLGIEANFGNDYFRIGGLKGFMDGSLGSSTAKMYAPYEGDAKNTGVFVTPPESMLAFVKTADATRLAICVHAIGDEANGRLLDLFEATAKLHGDRDRRFRIEHVQHLRPEDIKRFKELGVVASMQPYHLIDDARWAEGRIGKTRCESSYAYRSLLDAGAKLAFGSDWPVAPLNVLEGIDAAVNRRPLDGTHKDGWYPKQKITVAEAVAAYTSGSAYAAFQEKERGTLAPGYFGDFVLLSYDIFDAKEKDRIASAKVQLTVVGGKVVFGGK